jgi:hypothetical protein
MKIYIILSDPLHNTHTHMYPIGNKYEAEILTELIKDNFNEPLTLHDFKRQMVNKNSTYDSLHPS